MAVYDFAARVREEVESVQQELAAAGVQEEVARQAALFQVPQDVFLAGLFRAARRTGHTLRVMLNELARQQEREAAAAAERR